MDTIIIAVPTQKWKPRFQPIEILSSGHPNAIWLPDRAAWVDPPDSVGRNRVPWAGHKRKARHSAGLDPSRWVCWSLNHRFPWGFPWGFIPS